LLDLILLLICIQLILIVNRIIMVGRIMKIIIQDYVISKRRKRNENDDFQLKKRKVFALVLVT